MKGMITFCLAVSAIIVELSLAANAQGVESVRCQQSGDSLDGTQAVGRTQWAKKCFPYLKAILGGSESGAVNMRNTDGSVVPGYPTFALVNENGEILNFWKAPTEAGASCEGAARYSLIGLCRAGCYTPDQMVLFEGGYRAIGSQEAKQEIQIVTLGSASTSDHFSFTLSPLKTIVSDLEAHHQEIIEIQTEDGGALKVTPTHPLIDGDGRVREAKSLVVGDSLIRSNGVRTPISKLEKSDYFGKVYNVEVNSESDLGQIVVAQDFLNGSIYFQNEGVKELNRQILRSSDLITKKLLKE